MSEQTLVAADEHGSPRTIWGGAAIVIVAMLLTAVSVSAVFADLRWLPQVIITVFVVVISGAIFRSIPGLGASGAAVIVQGLLALIVVPALCVPDTMLLGIIPGTATYPELLSQLSGGLDDLYATTAPAASTLGFTTLLTVGFGLISMLLDGLVTDLRTPKVGGILLLLVWLIPVFLAARHLQWYHFVAIAAAFVLLMLSSYIFRLRLAALLLPVTAGALAVVLGIGLPLLLPDVTLRPERTGNPQGDLKVVNPFLDLKSNLQQNDDKLAFNYTAKDPLQPYWRLTSVSEFDGRSWQPAPFDLDPFAVAEDGLPWPAGLDKDTTYTKQQAQVTITGLDQAHLPSPYPPQQISGLSRRWIYDPDTLTIVGNGEVTTGAQYQLDYLSVAPAVKLLRSAPATTSSAFQRYLALPEALPEVVRSTADEVTAGAQDNWEKAALLQAYFRSDDFTYSLQAPDDASGDALADFLKDKRGYCVQFSAAMTTMARVEGIPARIGVGFTNGTASAGGKHEVRMNQAHAWPELYFAGAGWVPFEPTPGGPAGDPPPWSVADGSAPTEPETSPEPTTATTSAAAPEPTQTTAPSQTDDATGQASKHDSGLGVLPIIGVVLLVVLLCAIPALRRWLQRRNRLAGDVTAQDVWAEVTSLAADYRQPFDPAKTIHTNAAEVAKALPADAGDTLVQVAQTVEEQRYGAGTVLTDSSVDTQAARDLIKQVQQAYAARSSKLIRVLAVVLPSGLSVRG